MKKILLLNGFIAVVLMVCCGCASIVDGGRKKVEIKSNPPGATVTVSDEQGQTITTNTPAIVRLSRSKGYFQGQRYTVKFELPGYYPSEMQIHPRLDGWYFGNVLFGGAIGIVIVDPLTGAMWTLAPRKIDWNLISTSQNLTPEQLKAAEAEANPMDKKKKVATTGPKSGG